MQTQHDGRTYELTADTQEAPNLRADLIRRGWDGVVYHGVSKATGRQRKDMHRMFFRSAKSGHFAAVL